MVKQLPDEKEWWMLDTVMYFLGGYKEELSNYRIVQPETGIYFSGVKFLLKDSFKKEYRGIYRFVGGSVFHCIGWAN